MHPQQESVYYPEYLQLSKVLDAQLPLSEKYGNPAHDEMLFIVVHQAYELWFKQILHELNDVQQLFEQVPLPEKDLRKINTRLERIIRIQKLFLPHFDILESMTPLDFLDFRGFLHPASGFQSIQFREIEIRLGLKNEARVKFDQHSFHHRLSFEHQRYLQEWEKKPSLFDQINQWLERFPFLEKANFSFWQEYQNAVETMLNKDAQVISKNKMITEEVKEIQLAEIEQIKKQFSALLDPDEFAKNSGMRLSWKATLSALFIQLYRDEPLIHNPHQLLAMLMDIDESITTWRYRHALLAQRMLGTKIGTGGSVGHQYLRSTTEKNRIFNDLFTLSTYLIPRAMVPTLPREIGRQLGLMIKE